MAKSKRTFTTEVRKDWQDMVAETLRAIDRHAKHKEDDFHARSYFILKQYFFFKRSSIDLSNLGNLNFLNFFFLIK